MKIVSMLLVLFLAEVKFHQVVVTKQQQDVYAFRGSFGGSPFFKGIVVTSRCYKYAWNEPAVIRYEKNSRENRIMFGGDGSTCEVKSISFEEGAR